MPPEFIPSLSGLTGWRKSSYSGPDQGDCLEVLDGSASGVPVRDSKQPAGPALVFGPAAFSAFVASVRAGNFTG